MRFLMRAHRLPNKFRREIAVAFLMLLAANFAGCGQTEYDTRMDGALAVAAKRGGGGGAGAAPEEAHLAKDYVTIADATGRSTGVKFRLPVGFASANRLTPEVPAAKLAQTDIPGLSYTLQITLADNAQKQFPATCHVHVVPKAGNQLDALKNSILQGLTAVEANRKWTAGNVNGVPTGLPIHYVSVKGDMDFEVAGAVEKSRGTIAVFIVEGTADYAIVGWRYQQNSAGNNKLLEGISNSMITFVPEVAAPANPVPAKS
jgi:hypothetical protein